MRTAWRIALVAALVLAVVIGMVIAAALVWGLPHDHVRIFIDGEQIEIPPLTGGHWLVAAVVIALVSIVMMVVVPLALLLGLGIPLLVVAGVLVLLLSPLLLLGALVAWLWRRSTRAQSPA